MYQKQALAGFCAFLLAPAAWADVDWEWSFTSNTVNLAQSPSIYVTVTNLATSDEDIAGARIVLSSFGMNGVLVDPSNGSVLTPVVLGPVTPIAPGQSLTFEAMRFHFSGPTAPGLPSPGFEQGITPTMAMNASGCPAFGACVQTKASTAALTLTYAPVPEPATWALWFAGLAATAAAIRRRR